MPDGGWSVPQRPAHAARPPAFQGDEYRDLVRHCDQRLVEMRIYRSSYFSTWRELSDYIYPQRGRWSMPPVPNAGNKGTQRQQRIMDRTASKSVKDLASFLMAGITSPARNWFRLSTGVPGLDDNPGVKLWLAEVQKRLMRVFAASNFYNAMASVYEELATFGTGAMLVLQDFDDVIRCYALTAGEYLLDQDKRLVVNTIYREYVLKVAQLVERFGYENCSPAVQGLYQSNQLGLEVNIVHAVEPNFMHVPGRLGWRGMKWLSVWYEYGQRLDQALRVSGFHEFPAVAPRWDVVTTDTYGHGPGEEALPDVKTLQLLARREAEAIDKMVKPPLIGDAALANSVVSLLPGGVNFVPGASAIGLKPIYQVPPNIEGLRAKIMESRQLIQAAFHTDLIAMFSNPELHDMTAREVDAKDQEKMLLLGPMLERFHNEALTPLIRLVYGIMARGGLMPAPPAQFAGLSIEPDYISLLAQAQKAVGTTSIERTFAFAGNLAAANPTIMDKLDSDEALQEYADMLGVSPKVVRSALAVAKLRQQRAQIEQQQQAAQQGLAAVQGAQTLSKTDVGGGQNALQMMAGL